MVIITSMRLRYSNSIFRGLLLLSTLAMVGCASVKSTTQFYVPYTVKTYPPKSLETPIPILGKYPSESYTKIGRLMFETDEGWGFLRKSMVYNAQINGADAVVLKTVKTRQQTSFYQVPPRTDWVPSTGYYQGRHGKVYGYTTWVPYFQPGYTGAHTSNITGIDSDMIVFKK